MKELEIYSEKLGTKVEVIEQVSDEEMQVIMEDCNSSLVGWTHGGWNNDGGGASW